MQTFFEEIQANSLLKITDDKVILDILTSLVRPLQCIDESYPRRVLTYILTGDDANILSELESRHDDKAGVLMCFPGTFSHYWGSYDTNKAEGRLVTQSRNACFKLYRRIFNVLHDEQIIRYSKFLVAVTKQDNYVAFAEAPIWFNYLVIDALVKTQISNNFSDGCKHFKHSNLLRLLEMEEVNDPYKILLTVMFERKKVEYYYSNNLKMIFSLNDTVELLTTHSEFLNTLIPSLSSQGQLQFIDELAKQHSNFVNEQHALIVKLSTSTSKEVRKKAEARLGQLDNSVIQTYLKELLFNGNAKQRREIADTLANKGEENRKILQQALANEKQASVIKAIESALSRLDSSAEVEDFDMSVEPFEPIVSQYIPDSFSEVIIANYDELLQKAEESAEREIETNKTSDYKAKWAREKLKIFKKINPESVAKQLIDAINGKGKSGVLNNYELIEILFYKKKLLHIPEFGIHHSCRLVSNGKNYICWVDLFNEYGTPELFANIELRQLAQVFKECKNNNIDRNIAEKYLNNNYSDDLKSFMHTAEQIVPFFTENIDFLSEALGLLPQNNANHNYYNEGFAANNAIEILLKFPQLPKQFIPKLLEFALSDAKGVRGLAQQALLTIPSIHERAIEALGDGKQNIRISAIEWLVQLNQHDNSHKQQIVKALSLLKKKEKKEIVQASLLSALEQLGEDISKELSPTKLLKDAEKGLSGKILKSFEWFDLDSVPKVTWQNGKAVNKKIIQWWLVLAEKLKEPMPNDLLQRYMNLLSEKSQKELSLFVLQSFIHEDTRSITLEKALTIANKEAPQRLKDYQDYYQRWGKNEDDIYYARYANVTLEQVVEEIKNEHLSIYLGSAIKSKGMLALTHKADGSTAVKLLQDFMKRHHRRNAQVMAMLSVFSTSDDPLVIQLLLGLSRRYRTDTVKELAKELVTQIADRKNWTADELADRTIPTAGLDDDGILTLDYGSRTLTAYVDDKDKFVLQNEDGKTLKSLPAARQQDDTALIKEARSLFSGSKKELKQVLELQNARLYEAMCGERMWTSSDWLEYLFVHPIMKRLINRLVWLEIDNEGNILSTFRPSDDSSLLDADDEEITLQANSHIKLAHAALLTSEDSAVWLEHFKDYEIKPLFSQFNHLCPAFKKDAEIIKDFYGYVTDTFTLRGLLTKMGYQRASIEDGGSFDRYFKPFDSIGMSAVIVFSGSYVPEENIPAVLFELAFEKKQSYSWHTDNVPLAEVNPILLAESFAEYKKVADATAGFDENWQSKTLW